MNFEKEVNLRAKIKSAMTYPVIVLIMSLVSVLSMLIFIVPVFQKMFEGMGGKLQMRLTVIKEVKIGPYKFHQVPTYLYNDEFNVTAFPFTGGLIGNDLLRRFNMIINYPKREIHLQPNNHFKENFDYAYTGLGIYYDDGKIIVEDVIEGSPGAKAKFMVGDEVFAVNSNFSHNINAYKNILQTANEEIKVIVKRNQQLLVLNLYPVSIK